MSFFYDLNKKLDGIRATPEVTHQQLNERDMSRAAKGIEKYGKEGMQALAKAGREGKDLDKIRDKYNKYDDKVEEGSTGDYSAKKARAGKDIGKPGKAFSQIAKSAGERYGSKERGEKVAGAVLNKLRHPKEDVEEGVMDTVKSVGKKVASGVNRLVGHGSDEEMRKDLQRKSGAPVTGKKPEQRSMREAAGPLDFDKVLDAIAALYGDDIWNNDAMQDLANDLEQAGPTDKELDFIIAKGRLPKRLAGIQFSAGDDVQFGESGAPMSSKQKSFAALAPPRDKITFADKIAGAKKEVDEMLGDVAAEAMRSALSGGQKKLDKNHNGKLDANDFAMLRKGAKKGHSGEMDEEKSKGTAFDMSAPRQVAPKVGSVERGHKHDIKHTATGRMVTRRVDDQGNSVGADDDSAASGEKRGRGRPKGTKQSIGAKGPSGKSKLMTKEGDLDPADQGEYDQEGEMAKDDIKTVVRHAQALQKILGDDDNLPEWVQSKLAKIEGMMISIDEYMQNQEGDDDSQEPIAEKAVSKQQQKFMGMAHAMQKGEKIKGASKELKKVAKTMKPKDVEDFAATKHKGLPKKVSKKKEEEVEESTTSGAVATSTASGSSKGGVFGKGIYDSMNFELEQMIAESMSVNMSDSTEGGKSLTITATDEDALKLGMMLKNAGLGGGDPHGDNMHSHGEEPCETCGSMDCGCGDVQEAVDENAPDWPTNTETSDDALQYAGGLNKPKTDVAGDGQTTVPNTAVHTQDEDALRRMMEMAGIRQAELEPWKETMKEEELDEAEEDIEESIRRMRAIAGIKEAKKPDFLDMDKDGDKKEPMSKAVKDKEEKKVEESIFALTNQWKAYRG